MFEPVDSKYCTSNTVSHKPASLFFFPQLTMSIDLHIFALAIKKDFFLLKSCHLKAMFTGIDKEMQQIEQLVECLIKRTKHKCKE